jgi:hypothetical protein
MPAVAVLVVLLVAGPATARDPLPCEMKVVAEKLRDVFSARKITTIAVGEVTCVTERVKHLSEGKQHPLTKQPTTITNIPLTKP